MDIKLLKKAEGKETISGRAFTFTYEFMEGEKPAKIEAKAQTSHDGKPMESINVEYSLATDSLTKFQGFHVPVGEFGAIVTAVETAIKGIVESFNTPA